MIVAHELAHLKCGHLQWRWLMLPGLMIPLIGTALSRAREYTCDRYGYAAGGSSEEALRGLAILAAGPKYGQDMNLDQFVRQREVVNTGLMTLAEWLRSHPPLAKRIAALDSSFGDSRFSGMKGTIRALAFTPSFVMLGLLAVAVSVMGFREYVATLATAGNLPPPADMSAEEMAATVDRDFQTLSTFIEDEWWSTTATVPQWFYEVAERWEEQRPNEALPHDPHDGFYYGYETVRTGYRLWSSGPDSESGTSADIVFRRK